LPAHIDQAVNGDKLQRAVRRGVDGQIWAGKSKAWFLYLAAIGHNHMHIGQPRRVKEMILGKRGR
jgi:hypothetical protein